ncbi:radical SAM protein [Magnetospirillum sp. 64-120]|uniref:B12-binding domain-containing radical SAM protein n=1 Tax=Magnetospirillum sp. 64-120 TaxID=1895778 RepID=UPI00092C5DDC|nr:radical SAM protein [Magnetospirillum sp. 64-120]OJX67165.1 MAG: hypothetical protein BGO92_01140 [Magnetospirillum sp. 64-120]
MKLLLCVPSQLVHFDGVNARANVGVPLGILSMAAYLRAQDWPGTVDVYDARLSARFSNTETGNGQRIFGDDDTTIARRIAEVAPDVVGVSNMFSAQFGQALRMAEIVKQVRPQAVVVMGGPHVSVFPDQVLAHPAVDYVVIGEGEERLLALLQCLAEGSVPAIPGVMGRPEDARLLRPHPKVKVDFIQSMDDLPFPAYDMVDMDRYFQLQANGFSPRTREWGKRAVTMLTSRGCPHRCSFCSIHATMGYRWRPHSQDYVRRHIQLLRQRYAVDFIHFEDDNLTHDPTRFDALLDVLEGLDPPIRWDTPNGVRGDTWTAERVARTKRSGCQYLAVAIESGVQRVLDQVVRKRLNLEQVDDLMRFARAERLRVIAFYVIGMPGETLAEIDATLAYALRRYRLYGVWPGMNLAVALPGTELHQITVEQNLRDASLPYAANQITTQDFNPQMIRQRYKRFLRLRLLIFIWRTLTSPGDLLHNARLVLSYRGVAWREMRKLLGRPATA